jgi:hypothetical protein
MGEGLPIVNAAGGGLKRPIEKTDGVLSRRRFLWHEISLNTGRSQTRTANPWDRTTTTRSLSVVMDPVSVIQEVELTGQQS